MDYLTLRRSLKYALVPGKPSFGSPATSLQNQAFDFWYTQWSKVFDKLGKGEKPNPDDFLRQDLASVLLHQGQVVALHLYTFFDLRQRAAQMHSYFSHSYTPKAMKEMNRQGANTAMTFEYFTVSPEWRNSSKDVSLAATLLHIGFKVFDLIQADIALGVCRVDLGVAKLCYDAGGIPLDKNLTLHGVPCDLVGILQGKQKPYKDPKENELAAQLWSQRQDFSDDLATAARKAA